MHRVSVVIPCFNQAAFLGEAIESVIVSGHDECEIIVIDDGSTDDTREVARSFGDVIRYVHQPNRGLPEARNTGLRASAGEAVVFLDADDRLVPGSLPTAVRALAEAPEAAFAAGRYRTITEDGHPFAEPETIPEQQDWYGALLRNNMFGMPGSVMYRRDILLAEGGFDRRLRACEDYDVYLRLARRHPIAYHGAIVGEYRLRRGSMSSDCARMLSSSVRVLRGQPEAALNTRERRDAYDEGLRFWRRYYGSRLLQETHVMALEGAPWPALLRNIMTLLRWTTSATFRYWLGCARSNTIMFRVVSSDAAMQGETLEEVDGPNGEPVLLRLFPESTRAGEDFQLQPSGFSALGVECRGARKGACVVMHGEILTTTYGSTQFLTALVPKPLYRDPGNLRVYVIDGTVS